MSTENATANTPIVSLFQKAHGRMLTLQRVDEQINALLDQRRKLQEEIRSIQGQINGEFEHVLKQAEDGTPRITLELSSGVKAGRKLEAAEAA